MTQTLYWSVETFYFFLNQNKWYTHTHNVILLTLKKEGNLVICNKMNKLGGHYTKWKKPDKEWQILHTITYVKSKIVKVLEAEMRMVVTRDWGEGKRLIKENKVSVM